MRIGRILRFQLGLTMFAAVLAYAQNPTLHITKIQDHIRTHDEQDFSKALHTRIYTGTIASRVFTLEEAITAFSGSSHFEVGQDYEVAKSDDRIGKTLKVREHPDKKGHIETQWLTIISVEETAK